MLKCEAEYPSDCPEVQRLNSRVTALENVAEAAKRVISCTSSTSGTPLESAVNALRTALDRVESLRS